jgi:hypothetical protein
MENQQLREIIMRELPGILQRDREVRDFILDLSRQHFADRGETESRFDRLLDELRRDRERQDRKWEEQNRKWEENQRQLAAMQEEQNRRWQENQRQLAAMQEEQSRKWEENQRQLAAMQEEQNRRWQEQERKWEENQQTIRQMLEAIQALSRKHDSTIGALGARWGLYAEQSFRNALKGILEDTFGVEVLNVAEYDDEGEVFGHPDQVELDLIIKDGTLIVCEIKSSMSKGDMYIFERKVRFYEKKHRRQASRLVVISLMVDKQARNVAERLGIQVYSYAEDVPLAIFGPE